MRMTAERCAVWVMLEILSAKLMDTDCEMDKLRTGGKVNVKEVRTMTEPDIAAITGTIMMTVLHIMEGSYAEKSDIHPIQILPVIVAKKIKCMVDSSHLKEDKNISAPANRDPLHSMLL